VTKGKPRPEAGWQWCAANRRWFDPAAPAGACAKCLRRVSEEAHDPPMARMAQEQAEKEGAQG